MNRYLPSSDLRRTLTALAILLALSGQVVFAQLTVTSSLSSGVGTLDSAINNALPGDVISFDIGLNGGLIFGSYVIDKSLTIDASNLPSGITLEGTADGAVITTAAAQTVELNNITITNPQIDDPQAVGGIDNAGFLTMTNCELNEIGTSASLGLGPVIGGISSSSGATLRLFSCTFSSILATSVGAIDNNGTLEIENSTFSTVNAAGESIIKNQVSGIAVIDHTTMYNNSGVGIENDGSCTLTACLLDRNNNVFGLEVSLSGSFIGNHNVVGDDGNTIVGADNTFQNSGVNLSIRDLTLNGGMVPTCGLDPSSPAIDKVPAEEGLLLEDARRFLRDEFSDAGAFEFDGKEQFIVINTNDLGIGSLAQAIEDANGSIGPDSIIFLPQLSGQTILGTNFIITDTIIINGDLDEDDIPDIKIDGQGLTVNAFSLFNNCDLSVFNGIAIGNVNGVGISSFQNTGITISNCYIGTLDGTTEAVVNESIFFDETNGSLILGNVLSATPNAACVTLLPLCNNNEIIANLFGFKADGLTALGANTSFGVKLGGDNNAILNNLFADMIYGIFADTPNTGARIFGNSFGLNINDQEVQIARGIDIRIGESFQIGDGNAENANFFGSIGGVSINLDCEIGDISDAAINMNYFGMTPSMEPTGINAGIILNNMSASNFEVRNISIANNTIVGPGGGDGIKLETASVDLVTIQDNSIYNTGGGIELLSGANSNIAKPEIVLMDNSGALVGTSSPDALIQVFVDSLTQGRFPLATGFADASGDWSIPLSIGEIEGLGSAAQNITVTQDSAGRTSAFSDAFSIPSPTVPTINPLAANIANDKLTGTFDGSSTLTIELSSSGIPVGTIVDGNPALTLVDTDWTLDLSLASIGLTDTFDVKVTATDGGFSEEALGQFTLDLAAPIMTFNATLAPRVSAPFTVAITASEKIIGLEIADFERNNVDISDLLSTDSINYTFTVSPLVEGTVGFRIPENSYQDLGGNPNTQAPEPTFTFDATAAVITLDTLITSVVTPIVRGNTDEPLDSLVIILDGKSYEPFVSPAGIWSFTADSLPNGNFNITGLAVDQASNETNFFFENTLIIDTLAPVITVNDLSVIVGDAPFPSGTLIDGTATTLTVTVQGTNTSMVEVSDNGEWMVTGGLPMLTEIGTFDINVMARDTVGNQSSAVATLTVVEGIEQDSLGLLRLYANLGGDGWTNKTNWLADNSPVASWAGVTVENNRVVGLNLSSNNLFGRFPLLPRGTFDQLQSLDISNNNVFRLASLSRLVALTTLDVSGNNLQFEDLEPNSSINNFSYLGQGALGMDTIIAVQIGDAKTLSLSGVDSVDNYIWKKGTEALPDELSADLKFDPVEKATAGKYTCEVTNDSLPDLVLTYTLGTLIPTVDIGGVVTNSFGGLPIGEAQVNLLRVAPRRYDTLRVTATDSNGDYKFERVSALNNYLVSALADTSVFMGTYHGDVIRFRAATLLQPSMSLDTINIRMLNKPVRTRFGRKRIFGSVEEDFEDSVENNTARIEARRRVSLAGVSLYRQKTRLRKADDVDLDLWELIAYTQTDEDGNFSFGSLENDIYLIQIEYPGASLTDASVVEFDLTNTDNEEEEIELSALVTDDGIAVEQVNITSVKKALTGHEVDIYPSPFSEKLNIKWKINARHLEVKICNMYGQCQYSKTLAPGYGLEKIDAGDLPPGIYVFQLYINDEQVFTQKMVKEGI